METPPCLADTRKFRTVWNHTPLQMVEEMKNISQPALGILPDLVGCAIVITIETRTQLLTGSRGELCTGC
jgi:hypothetical protein